MIIDPPTDLQSVIRLVSAMACAGVIGLERDRRSMPTGFRTLGLVGLGACAAVIAALKVGDSDGFSRVAQGIVTGIGFLGAGVILQGQTLRDVKGLTTAAAIWLSAAIGLLCGAGQIMLAAITTGLALVLLLGDVLTSPKRKNDQDGDREHGDPGPPPVRTPPGAP